MTKEQRVWVELEDSIEQIDIALEKEENKLDCGGCGNPMAVSYYAILRNPSKIDTMTGQAVKVRKKGYLCHSCLKELKEELKQMLEE